MFKVTTLSFDKVPRTEDGMVNFSEDFFGRAANLTVSGQLEGELGATAFGEIYTFGPTFRAENSNTARHLAEFWMMLDELECLLDDLIDITRKLFCLTLVREFQKAVCNRLASESFVANDLQIFAEVLMQLGVLHILDACR